MTYSEIIYCIGGFVLLTIFGSIGAKKLHFFLHGGLIDYLEQKISDPTIKPSRRVKYTARFGMYMGVFGLLTAISFVIYASYSAGDMIATGCVTSFALLILIVFFVINSVWRKIDL